MSTLNSMLDRSAQEGGERTFLVHEGRSFSFADVYSQVRSIAEGLRLQGIKKGDRVAIVHRNAPEFVIAYFAINRLGAVAVPINFMVQKADELAYMLKDSGAAGVFTQTEFLPGLTGAVAKCPALKALWVTDYEPKPGAPSVVRGVEELRAPVPEGPASDPVLENDVASILYTSGTTGFPKGVMLTHRNLVTNCESTLKRITLTRKDVTLCILPMFHSFAWTAIVLTSTRLTLKCVISRRSLRRARGSRPWASTASLCSRPCRRSTRRSPARPATGRRGCTCASGRSARCTSPPPAPRPCRRRSPSSSRTPSASTSSRAGASPRPAPSPPSARPAASSSASSARPSRA